MFVSVSRVFLGQFLKFKELVGEQVKTILTALVTVQKKSVASQILIEERYPILELHNAS